MCDFTQAARETGALKEAKDKLEKQVEEITWRLQLEKRLRVIIICCEGQLFLLASCSQMSLFSKKEKRKKKYPLWKKLKPMILVINMILLQMRE